MLIWRIVIGWHIGSDKKTFNFGSFEISSSIENEENIFILHNSQVYHLCISRM